MATLFSAKSVLLGACAGSLLVLGSVTASRALDNPMDGVKAAGSTKDSPYAAAKDEAAGAMKALGGTRAAGSSKDSPYASAKDENNAALEPTLTKLWALVVPVGLAAGSYLWLRSREGFGRG